MGRKKGRQTIFAPTTPTVSIIPEATVDQKVDQKVGDAFDNMSGLVFAFAGTTAPSGWLVCNGQAVSRTVYANLFAVIGTSHGDGDGSTTFNLPDYRGRFLRGVDGGVGRDPDRAGRTAMSSGGNSGDSVGSVQGHAFQTHTHTQVSHSHAVNAAGAGPNVERINAGVVNAQQAIYNTSSVAPTINSTAATGAHSQATANETRPVNANVNYIIKT